MRQKILNEKKLLVPYLNGKMMALDTDFGQGVILMESGACLKPWIAYNTCSGIVIYTMMYDTSLETEASEKGASWLLSKLEPDGTNVIRGIHMQKAGLFMRKNIHLKTGLLTQ